MIRERIEMFLSYKVSMYLMINPEITIKKRAFTWNAHKKRG